MRRPLLGLTIVIVGLSLSAAGTAVAADELTPEKVGQIKQEERAALAKVDQAHGGKKPSEMTSEERKQVIAEQAAAVDGVLQKHGVDSKAFARYSSTLSKDGLAEAKVAEETAKKVAEEKALAEQVSKSKAEADKSAEGAGSTEGQPEPVIQKGFSDDKPVELEAAPDAPPVIEVGLPEGEAPPAE